MLKQSWYEDCVALKQNTPPTVRLGGDKSPKGICSWRPYNEGESIVWTFDLHLEQDMVDKGSHNGDDVRSLAQHRTSRPPIPYGTGGRSRASAPIWAIGCVPVLPYLSEDTIAGMFGAMPMSISLSFCDDFRACDS